MFKQSGFMKTGFHMALILFLVLGVVACKKNKVAPTRIGPEDEAVNIDTGAETGEGEGAGMTDSINTADLPPRDNDDLNTGEYGVPTDTSGRPFLEVIYFDYDKSDIRSDQGAALEQNAAWILQHPKYKVLVEGHCDERGSNEYNLGLGQRRADAILKFLIEQGVPLERLNTISYGEERPAEGGHTEAAWAKNRRAEFKVRE